MVLETGIEMSKEEKLKFKIANFKKHNRIELVKKYEKELVEYYNNEKIKHHKYNRWK